MTTDVVKIFHGEGYRDAICRAAQVLRDGGLVGFPTETVYGVGARADRLRAVTSLREAKGRDENKPFTVHISRPADVDRYVTEISPIARRFIRKAWPGPLTLVFNVEEPSQTEIVRQTGAESIETMFSAGSIGIRCPDDVIACDLLAEANVPVVAASANRAGMAPPRSAEGVLAELDGKVNLVLDGGVSRYAKPSTVVRLYGAAYEILREGVMDRRMLQRLAALRVLFVCSGNTCRSPMAAALFQRMLADKVGCGPAELADRQVFIDSAGAFASGGAPASPEAVAVLAERGVNLTGHTSRGLNIGVVHEADVIYCMTRKHVDAVLALAPTAAAKTELLAGNDDIVDPFGGSVDVYRTCADNIHAALTGRLAEIEA